MRKKEDSLSPKRQPEALVFIKQASYNTTYNVTVDGKTASFTTLDGVAPADQPADKLSSSEIAQSLGNQIQGLRRLHSRLFQRHALDSQG